MIISRNPEKQSNDKVYMERAIERKHIVPIHLVDEDWLYPSMGHTSSEKVQHLPGHDS
jgi:hypothetical protein